MKKSLLFTVFLLISFLHKVSMNAQVIQMLPDDFEKEISAQKDPQLIDVCTPGEFAQRHIKGAVNLDFYKSDFKEVISLYDKESPMYVYCLAGGRSAQVVSLLSSLGFSKIIELKGGIKSWMNSGKPVVQITEPPKGMSDDEFNGLLASSSKVLVVFSTTWCPPCKKLQPVLDEVQTDLKESVLIHRLDGDTNKNQADRNSVEGFPTMVYYINGKEVWRNKGFIAKEEILKELNKF